jgi:hypothetical protein
MNRIMGILFGAYHQESFPGYDNFIDNNPSFSISYNANPTQLPMAKCPFCLEIFTYTIFTAISTR